MFITFEGIEGTGKTTQIGLTAEWLAGAGVECVRTREPGGGMVADRIRAVLLDAANADLAPEAELLLYVAARAQHVAELLRPALAEGRVVLCDRYADATEAYQGHARGLGADRVRDLSAQFTGALRPDLTLLFDLEPDTGLARAKKRADAATHREDRFEREGVVFQARVREGYLAIAKREPERVKLIDANGSPDEVFARVRPIVAAALGIDND